MPNQQRTAAGNEAGRFQKALLAWYRKRGRPLPWRETRDPYRIWVSEIMLQQTQVETVLPYFDRFLAAFPTVNALARAPLVKVLKLWEGLGYYARARNLHKGARLVVRQWEGALPRTEGELLKIPGIGKSTAGAILSLAFEVRAPILDGNVKRVLCRFFAVREDPRESPVIARLWALSDKLTPVREVHDYTQAIMDLGATVCTPRDPACPACPVTFDCSAFRQNLQDKIPIRPVTIPVPHRQFALGWFRKGGRVLIVRWPEQGLLGGLWGFPRYARQGRTGFAETLRAGAAGEFGLELAVGRKTGRVRHAYSHFRTTLHVFECQVVGGQVQGKGRSAVKWVFPSQFLRYPFSGADRKVIQLFESLEG